MKLTAFFKLLNKKISAYNSKAQNPFFEYNHELNPFSKPICHTMVWIEPDDSFQRSFKKNL